MNEQTQKNRHRSYFLNIFIQEPVSLPFQTVTLNLLDCGSVHASKIG